MTKTYITLVLLGLFSIVEIQAQTEAEIVASEIVKSDIKDHIYYLASDELKGRETGTPEIDMAATYIADKLKAYKVQPAGDKGSYFQNIPFRNIKPLSTFELKIGNTTISDLIGRNHVNIDYTGDFIYVEGSATSDTDVSGKIVIINNTSENLRNLSRSGGALREKLEAKGAKAIIELVKTNPRFWLQYRSRMQSNILSFPSDNGPGITHLWLQDNDGVYAQQFSNGKISGSLKAFGSETSIVNSKNVVGIVEGSDPHLKNEYIIYSAHYDHVGIGKPNAQNDSIYNGARDNAVGTVTVLSAAKSIAQRPTKRSALFILFTAEEKGLLGSKWYVEHPVVPLEQVVFCFNSDNGGYNDTTLATIVGLNRTTEGALIKKAVSTFGLTATDDPTGSLFNRSDNVQFARKGIPAPTFSLGFTAFDEEIGKYYHQASDNPDTLDYDYLEQFFRAYVLSCRYIGDNEKTPFWTEGDSYYETGLELYNK